jgi:hypothetical protein
VPGGFTGKKGRYFLKLLLRSYLSFCLLCGTFRVFKPAQNTENFGSRTRIVPKFEVPKSLAQKIRSLFSFKDFELDFETLSLKRSLKIRLRFGNLLQSEVFGKVPIRSLLKRKTRQRSFSSRSFCGF